MAGLQNEIKKRSKGRNKIGKVMREFKEGTLTHGGTGKPVPRGRPDIARAIALSEARKAGARIPKK